MTECTQKAAGHGRLNHVSIGAAQGGLSVIPGMVRVNLIPATILLHFGTSHTFLSEEFDKLHGMSSLSELKQDSSSSWIYYLPILVTNLKSKIDCRQIQLRP